MNYVVDPVTLLYWRLGRSCQRCGGPYFHAHDKRIAIAEHTSGHFLYCLLCGDVLDYVIARHRQSQPQLDSLFSCHPG